MTVNTVLMAGNLLSARNSDSFDVTISQTIAHVIVAGLAGAEVADIQVWSDIVSGNWVDYYHDGDKQTLTATQTGRTVMGYGRYRVQVPSTAGIVGVEVNFGLPNE